MVTTHKTDPEKEKPAIIQALFAWCKWEGGGGKQRRPSAADTTPIIVMWAYPKRFYISNRGEFNAPEAIWALCLFCTLLGGREHKAHYV
jgi:hypothetical protein